MQPLRSRSRPTPDSAFAAHGGLVWTICRRLSPDPEDAFQECWEKVLRALPSFDPEGAALSTWIAVITHRHLVDRHRRRRVRGEVLPFSDFAGAQDVEREAATREAIDQLDAELARLPVEQRRVVVMHHVHGIDLETIAAAEGVPIGTVKSRLHRGRAALVAGREER
jgi:RNA polymerase sigma factor (sigma-70 family)